MSNGERTVRVLLGAVLTIAALTACTARVTPPDHADQAVGNGASVGPPATGTASDAPSLEVTPPTEDPAVVDDPGGARLDAAITLIRTGGVAGGKDTATVKADGTWTLVKGTTTTDGKLSVVLIAKLNGFIGDPGLAEPGEPSKIGEQCPDRINWTLTVGGTEYRTNTCGEPPNDVFSAIVGAVADATGI